MKLKDVLLLIQDNKKIKVVCSALVVVSGTKEKVHTLLEEKFTDLLDSEVIELEPVCMKNLHDKYISILNITIMI